MTDHAEQRQKEYNSRVIRQNERVKADKTDGMNTLKEMDLEMPEGLAFQLGMNPEAMKNFTGMSSEQRLQLMDESRKVTEKEQMTQLIDRLASNSFQ